MRAALPYNVNQGRVHQQGHNFHSALLGTGPNLKKKKISQAVQTFAYLEMIYPKIDTDNENNPEWGRYLSNASENLLH